MGNPGMGTKQRGISPRLAAAGAFVVLGLSGCGQGDTALPGPAPAAALSSTAVLGQKIFFDVGLSASGAQSCATCHDPARAHAGADDVAVPLGGKTMSTTGFRNAPSLDYLAQNPAFFFDGEGTPTGG